MKTKRHIAVTGQLVGIVIMVGSLVHFYQAGSFEKVIQSNAFWIGYSITYLSTWLLIYTLKLYYKNEAH